MATVSFRKTGARGAFKASAKASATPTDFVINDSNDDVLTIVGQDKAGNPVDISTLATITVTSSDPSVITVDPPSGMSCTMHSTGKLSTPGSPVNIVAVATWKDGSVGPFQFTLPCDVVTGPAGAIVIQPSTPTVH